MIIVTSFGYLHGAPPRAHLVVDVRRSLHNPAADPVMRELTGRDERVRRHVLTTPRAGQLLDNLLDATRSALPAVQGQDLRVAIGCAGGRHRSVVLADELARLLTGDGLSVEVAHRDVDRPVVRR